MFAVNSRQHRGSYGAWLPLPQSKGPLGHRYRSCGSEWAGRLEVDRACREAPATIYIASCAVAPKEFELITSRWDRANDRRERPIAVDVGRDHTDFDLGRVPGHTLSRECLTGTAATVGGILTKGCRKRAAKEVDADLI